jgi:hypothetical protein
VVCKVHINDHPDLASRFRVNAVPTVLVVKGGAVVARFVGVQRERTLKDALDGAREPVCAWTASGSSTGWCVIWLRLAWRGPGTGRGIRQGHGGGADARAATDAADRRPG